MFQISIERIKRHALVLGVVGAVMAVLLYGVKEAAGFIVGAVLSLMTIESWFRVTASLNPQTAGTKPSVGASGLFLALRYLLMGAAIYATVKVLGVTPLALLLGLFVSFAAVVIEIVQQFSKK